MCQVVAGVPSGPVPLLLDPFFYLPLTGLNLCGGGDIELCPGMELNKQ